MDGECSSFLWGGARECGARHREDGDRQFKQFEGSFEALQRFEAIHNILRMLVEYYNSHLRLQPLGEGMRDTHHQLWSLIIYEERKML